MLSFTEFEKYIKLIKEYEDKDSQISELLDTEGFITYSSPLITALVELLEVLMQDDTDNWIQYWLWECNFGETGEAWDADGVIIPMNSIGDLYAFLEGEAT